MILHLEVYTRDIALDKTFVDFSRFSFLQAQVINKAAGRFWLGVNNKYPLETCPNSKTSGCHYVFGIIFVFSGFCNTCRFWKVYKKGMYVLNKRDNQLT